jgi:hypothetical protein
VEDLGEHWVERGSSLPRMPYPSHRGVFGLDCLQRPNNRDDKSPGLLKVRHGTILRSGEVFTTCSVFRDFLRRALSSSSPSTPCIIICPKPTPDFYQKKSLAHTSCHVGRTLPHLQFLFSIHGTTATTLYSKQHVGRHPSTTVRVSVLSRSVSVVLRRGRNVNSGGSINFPGRYDVTREKIG